MISIHPDLERKTILVTGAMRGIGRAIIEALAHNKSHILFNFRAGKEAEAESLKKTLLDLGAARVDALMFDVTKPAEIKEALDAYLKDGPAISGLVNNAGISKDQLLLRLKEEEMMEVINTNLLGTMRVTQLLTRNFLKAENVSIVNMGSVVGLMGNTAQSAYAASKAGVIGFTKSVARELAGKNVRCNALCPGFIDTDMTKNLDEKVKEYYLTNIPLKRLGKADEVANATLFLLSNASSYTTGEVLKIDGGIYI